MNVAYPRTVGQATVIDLDLIESVRPTSQGVVIRYLNGRHVTLHEPYYQVLEWLERAESARS